MLYTELTHPGILKALAGAGHGGQVLIADGNYPFSTRSNRAAERVYLNVRPGLVTVTDVLEVISQVIPIEAAHVMQPADGSEPTIFKDFRRMLPSLQLQPGDRFTFYDLASRSDVALTIATGDQRLYANILLTIGVVLPT